MILNMNITDFYRYTARKVVCILTQPQLLILELLLAGQQTWAAEPSYPQSSPARLAFSDMLQWSLGLLFVLLAIFACAWLLRKLSGFSSPLTGALRVRGGVSLGSREKAILLQVGNRQLLLGVTPSSVTTLYVLEEGESIGQHSDCSTSRTDASFARRLQGVIQREKHEQS